MSIALKVDGQRPKTVYMAKRRQQVGIRLEIDMPEHHYNNIMAFDSVSFGRVPYKGIIMYAINAIKHGKVLDQQPTTKNDLGVDAISRADAIRVASGYCHPSNVAKELAKLPSIGRYDPYTDKFIKE